MENQKFQHPEGKIQLMNGTLIDCYPLQQTQNEIDNSFRLDTTGEYLVISRKKRTPQEIEQRQAEEAKAKQAEDNFAANAFLFFDNRERILADSRMFLAPVPVQNGLMYTGTSGFQKPTLGVYIEWWQNCLSSNITDKRDQWLIYQFGGSPLTGWNISKMVNASGEKRELNVRSFSDLWRPFVEINRRYDDAKKRYEAYSIDKVIELLKSDARTIDTRLKSDAFFLTQEIERKKAELEKKMYDSSERGKYRQTLIEFDEQYKELSKQLSFNKFAPVRFWIDIHKIHKNLSAILPTNECKRLYVSFLQYVVDALKKETEQIAEREAENRKQQIFAEIEVRKDAVVNFYIEYQAREKRLEEYEKQYKSEVAELKRRLRAGSIGNKGYQKAFTPLRKKMEQRKFDLDNFKVKSINEIFERGDSISDDGYFEYIKDFLKARK